MLFNSLEFLLLFLPVTLIVALRLRRRALILWLGAMSCVFYAFTGQLWFLAPMIASGLVDYLVARRLEDTEGRRARALLLVASLGFNLGLLVVFKYSAFIAELSAWLLRAVGRDVSLSSDDVFWRHLLLPAGISFYTFQTMSYAIDVYRGSERGERSLHRYFLFVTFFPQLVAGPLARWGDLGRQIERLEESGVMPRWREGTFLFTMGLCKKVLIADRLAQTIDPSIHYVGALGASEAWLALVGYALQIYFDFSGYTDMAVGLGRLFGLELPQNFDSPYRSRDPSEFWRRWHMTLSAWIRDYLYIPLGGNRGSRARVAVNLVVTMALAGLWHGAAVTFVVWGLYHGALLVLFHITRGRWNALPRPLAVLLTFGLVCVGWVFFRATSLEHALDWISALSGLRGAGGLGDIPPLGALLVVCALGIAWFAPTSSTLSLAPLSRGAVMALALAGVCAVVLMNYSSTFIYYRF